MLDEYTLNKCMLQCFTIFFQKWTACPLHCAIYYWICIKLTYICILRLSIIQSSVIITTFISTIVHAYYIYYYTVLPYRPFVLYVMTPKNYIVVYTHSLSLSYSIDALGRWIPSGWNSGTSAMGGLKQNNCLWFLLCDRNQT